MRHLALLLIPLTFTLSSAWAETPEAAAKVLKIAAFDELTVAAGLGDGGSVGFEFLLVDGKIFRFVLSKPMTPFDDPPIPKPPPQIVLRPEKNDDSVPLRRGGQEEKALLILLKDWIARKYTETDLLGMEVRSPNQAFSSEQRRVQSLLNVIDVLQKRAGKAQGPGKRASYR